MDTRNTLVFLTFVALLGVGCAAPSAVSPGSSRVGGVGVAPEVILPQPEEEGPEARAEFDQTFRLRPGYSIAVGDELDVTLLEITDSRCPKDVVCVWAGELGVKLRVTVRNGGESEEVALGQTTAPKKTVYLREFTLISAAEDAVEISVFSVPQTEEQLAE